MLAAQDRRVVVVAPPGTGKTFCAIRLAARLARDIYDHQRILVLTFSNQARAELHREARRLVPTKLTTRVEIRNYHQLFREKVWAYRSALGLPAQLDLISERERLDALRGVLGRAIRRGQEHLWSEVLEHTIPAFRGPQSPPLDLANRAADVVTAQNRSGLIAFGDLGYYFWQLLERFPVLERAAREAYPVVIADEHQDSSALQDAVVRRLAAQGRLIIFADDLQLIHGWRGADEARLIQHRYEAESMIELRSSHRWADEGRLGSWVLQVRGHFLGRDTDRVVERPDGVAILSYPTAHHRYRQAFPYLAGAAARALQAGAGAVAILCPWNPQASELRDYLARRGMYPRQLGGPEDFEFARNLQVRLPMVQDGRARASLVLDVLDELVPQLGDVERQVRARIGAGGPNITRAGGLARALLDAMRPIWNESDPSVFFSVVWRVIEIVKSGGHYVPRSECLGPIQKAARDRTEPLMAYAKWVAAARFSASAQVPRGLLVMTVHQAKGKEFDSVIVGFVGRETFPDDLDGRRLLYVAMTRARRRLTLVVPEGNPSPLLGVL